MCFAVEDRKSTRLNSSHTEIYTLSLHDALPIYTGERRGEGTPLDDVGHERVELFVLIDEQQDVLRGRRSEEHTSELQSHRDLHSFPTRRSSDLHRRAPR